MKFIMQIKLNLERKNNIEKGITAPDMGSLNSKYKDLKTIKAKVEIRLQEILYSLNLDVEITKTRKIIIALQFKAKL